MFHHLETERMSYVSHFLRAIRFSKDSLLAAFYFAIHAIYPDVYRDHGSRLIHSIHQRLDKQD